MTPLAEEAARIVESLPEPQVHALMEYARYLFQKADDEEWDRKFCDPKYQPKFQAMLDDVKRQIDAGLAESLDLDRL